MSTDTVEKKEIELTKSQKNKRDKNPIVGYWPSKELKTYTKARVAKAMAEKQRLEELNAKTEEVVL